MFILMLHYHDVCVNIKDKHWFKSSQSIQVKFRKISRKNNVLKIYHQKQTLQIALPHYLTIDNYGKGPIVMTDSFLCVF